MWLLLTGCAPGPLDADEAERVYQALSSVQSDVYALLWARAEADSETTAGGKGITWTTDAGGTGYSGTFDGPGSWTGSVDVSGTYTPTADDGATWARAWAADLDYVDVGYGTATLDGPLTWDLSSSGNAATFEHHSALIGLITLGGVSRGAGEVELTTTVTLSGGRYLVETVGTIGGNDVSRDYDASAFGL